jgi:hypothetical protein
MMLIALGMGLSLNNTRAVIEALVGVKSAFKRTPKFAITGKESTWLGSAYVLPKDLTLWWEALLMLYAIFLIGWSLSHMMMWLVGWLALYVLGYGILVYLALIQSRWASRSSGDRFGQAQTAYRPSNPIESGD